MIVEQIPLPFTAIHSLPPPLWPVADPVTDDGGVRSGADALAANRPRDDELSTEPTGWPRIFPGL
jgi:hypothetical protein